MYHKTAIFLLIFLAAVLEISLFPNIFPGNVSPNIILVLIVIWSSQRDFEQVWIWAILAGFILDILMFLPLGVNAISFLLVAFGIGFAIKRFFVIQKTKSFFTIAILILGATLINHVSVKILFGLIGYSSEQGSILFSSLFQFQNLFFQILGNLIVFSLIYWPIVLKNKLALK